MSLTKQHMRDLLLALDPALHPVVIMGTPRPCASDDAGRHPGSWKGVARR